MGLIHVYIHVYIPVDYIWIDIWIDIVNHPQRAPWAQRPRGPEGQRWARVPGGPQGSCAPPDPLAPGAPPTQSKPKQTDARRRPPDACMDLHLYDLARQGAAGGILHVFRVRTPLSSLALGFISARVGPKGVVKNGSATDQLAL